MTLLADAVKPLESALVEMKRAAIAAGGTVNIGLYVTGHAGNEEKGVETPSCDDTSTEGGDSSLSASIPWTTGRPDIRSLIKEKGRSCPGSVGVAGKCCIFMDLVDHPLRVLQFVDHFRS